MDKPQLRLVTEDARPAGRQMVDLDPEARTALSRLSGAAAASAASVLAQMVRAPVPAAELDVQILPATQAVMLPPLQAGAAVRAHRGIRGELAGDLLMGQSDEMAAWLGSNLSSLGSNDPDWTRQRLSDLAGISLAAFGLSLGRAVDMRLEPELSTEDGLLGPDVALRRAVSEERLALVMQSRSRDQKSIGDFFFFAAEEDLSLFISAALADL